MARVKGPLHSLDAHGTLAGRMQFRRDRRGVHVYHAPEPERVNQAPPSENQAIVRDTYRAALALWRAFTDAERKEWNEAATASGESLSGWNLFLRGHMAADLPRIPRDVSILAGAPPCLTTANTVGTHRLRLRFADFFQT